ncbi:MAG TPA: formylglycine-generating enzyme family protein [Thermoanaerobaculia bacterium]
MSTSWRTSACALAAFSLAGALPTAPSAAPASGSPLPATAATANAAAAVVAAGGLWIEPGLGMRFRYVPPGSFLMGSPPEEPARNAFEEQHRVTLTRAVWMGETEVTQAQWRRLMGNDPAFFLHCGGDCPVELVNWYEAAAFANRLSARAGLPACYELSGCRGTLGGGCARRPEVQKCDGDYRCGAARLTGLDCQGFRLPTEAEWEHAARAGTATALPDGDLTILGRNDAPALDRVAWYGGDSGVSYPGGMECARWSQRQEPARTCGPHPVAGKRPNAWGLHDVLGNVWELTEDRAEWDDAAGRLVTDTYGGPETDPLCRKGSKHVLRGGSWYALANTCRLAARGSTHDATRVRTVGFRLARTAG